MLARKSRGITIDFGESLRITAGAVLSRARIPVTIATESIAKEEDLVEKIGIETEVSIGPLELSLEAAAKLSTAADRLAMVISRSRRTSSHRSISATASANSAGRATLTITDTPPVGRFWEVCRYVISGSDPMTEYTTGIIVRTYRGKADAPFDLVDWTDRIPDVGAWDVDQFTMQPSDSLVVTADGLTEGDAMVLAVDVIEHEINFEGV
jgi:hypothetical protein